MDRGVAFASVFLGAAGAGIWFAGMVCHVALAALPFALIQAVFGPYGFVWSEILVIMLWGVAGPVLVAVGGGMRFFAGLLNGKKMAGCQVRRILWLELGRYELFALGTGTMIGTLWLPAFGVEGGAGGRILLVFATLGGLLVIGLGAIVWGGRLAITSGRLMKGVREEAGLVGHVPEDEPEPEYDY